MPRPIEEIRADLRQIEHEFYWAAKDRDDKLRHYQYACAQAEGLSRDKDELLRELSLEAARQKGLEAAVEERDV